MRLKRWTIVTIGLILSGCATGTSSQFVTVNGTTIETDSASASAGPLSAGVSTSTVSIPYADDATANPLIGGWMITRNGSHLCDLELLDKNAAGDHRAKTRSCASIDLARIALWTTDGTALTLFDFDRRAVVTLKPVTGAYQGTLADGTLVTVQRA